MTSNGWLQILLFLAAVAAATVPLGRFIARVFASAIALIKSLSDP